MHCAHEGQSVASSRHTEARDHTNLPPAQREQDESAEVIGSILGGHVSLSEREVSILAAHLHACSAQCASPAELSATLQACHVLLQERQAAVIAGCGLPFWLLNLIEDLVLATGRGGGGGGGGDLLGEVVEMVVQASSVLLVSASTGNVGLEVPLSNVVCVCL